uniref:Uncharacterized protein n=1 Tax=Arundo donax TaxID=35708 RepID=A0A0A9FYC7_ARUDO
MLCSWFISLCSSPRQSWTESSEEVTSWILKSFPAPLSTTALVSCLSINSIISDDV